ncbi:MAG TPA: PIG-L family deacetylase [Bryobacteraceae bacterium]|jgi:LmbE family N-acetylglucosaminyl deacetylase|nr:PIG-L family deacetylase [Bryobacteraceae bacterium]
MRPLAFTLPLTALLLLAPCPTATAQRDLSGAAEITLQLEKLNVLGSVLMIAAHPDDENTALLTYFARGRKARTAYLSATRGEGGQNLLGPEQGDLLGVIRTQELLAARRIDGAQQFFTRAVDFGFTKTVDETLSKWGRDRILSDMVWTIRHYRPDVIILQFSGTSRDGHGQHQASAILGKEAYFAAADKSRFPEQQMTPWKAKRLLHNVRLFSRGREQTPPPSPGQIEIDTGAFNPVLGRSYSEIAGISRSQHRSQAMGAAERRGPYKSYLTTVAGDPVSADVFDGVDTTWNRLPGGAAIGSILAEAARAFSPLDPSRTIPLLLKARPLIARIAASPGQPWAAVKLKELDETVAACAGLWLDVTSDRPTAIPGSSLQVTLTAINRSQFPLSWLGPATPLEYNQVRTRSLPITVPADRPYSQPFWLAKAKTGSSYTIDRQEMRDKPDSPPFYLATFEIQAGTERIELQRPLHYRYVEPDRGELTRPVQIVPPVAVSLSDNVLVFPNGKAQRVLATVKANIGKTSGELRLEVGQGWKVEPAARTFHLGDAGEQAEMSFEVTPARRTDRSTVRAVATISGRPVASGMRVINYPHIPIEMTFPPSEARAERFDVTTLARKVGYVTGAGDDVPQALRQLGCEVTLLGPDDLASRNLSEFDAIVTGVRAYNVRSDLRANQNRLLNYIQEGGTVVVQYNFTLGGATRNLARIGPYAMSFGQERTTLEEAPVSFPDPDHPLLFTPNKITERDFDGWIQERAVYFATEWDTRYQPVLESHDPGDRPQLGGMLYTRYGKGAYVFTSFAFFRQLPAGVPGAYRIFANLLSAGKAARP